MDQSRQISEQEDDLQSQQHVSLQIFYDQKQDVKDSKPLGFGWQHELKFCYADFQFTTRADEYGAEEQVVKSLT